MQLLAQQSAQVHEHPRDARVVELARDRRIDRHGIIGEVELRVIAAPLLAHISQRVLSSSPVVLIQHHEVCKIDHVDFFELTGRAVVGRHHVDRQIHEIDDFRIRLTDTGGLDNDKVVALSFEEGDRVLQHCARRGMLTSGRQRAHVEAIRAQRVHADTIAEQRAAAATSCRVDGDDRDAHGREGGQEAQHHLIDHRRLTSTTGAGDTNDGRLLTRQFPPLA